MLHNIFFLLWIFLHTPTIHPGLFAVYIPSGGTFLPLPAPFPYILAEYTNIYVYMHVSARRQKQRPEKGRCAMFSLYHFLRADGLVELLRRQQAQGQHRFF